jgi:hypothetical protein
MNCNNIINAARQYCIEHSMQYHFDYEQLNWTGIGFYKYWVTDALLYWFEALIDYDFLDAIECKNRILSCVNMPLHGSDVISTPPNKLGEKIIDNEKQGFIEYITDLDEDHNHIIELPYRRTIVGEERTKIAELLANNWNYTVYPYWNPIYKRTEKETLFISFDCITEYVEPISIYISINNPHVFRYGEGIIEGFYCAETSEFSLDFSLSEETTYFDKEATWLVYLSHEGTITFAGAILPKIKEILAAVQDHWNEF